MENENETSPSVIPALLAPFDVEIVKLGLPLRVYVFTFSAEEWERAKQAVAQLPDLAPLSFIELDEGGGGLRGVYASNLTDVFYDATVEMIQETAYGIQNNIQKYLLDE